MVDSTRILSLCALALVALAETGCNMVPQRTLQQSQLRTQQLYAQNRQLALQQNGSLQSLLSEKQLLAQQNAALRSNLDTANQRLNNLTAERGTLQQNYQNLLASSKNQPSPLSNDATRRFEDLSRRYPDFQFDPQTGVSKFQTDIVFELGSDSIKPSTATLLSEFTQIMNREDSKHLNILVVGHTDDRPIVRKETAAKHPTNWHLSTNRANSVALSLARNGLREQRMGVAGYGPYQPVEPNTTDAGRAKNRRVEIFVLAPDAVVAGWDPEMHR